MANQSDIRPQGVSVPVDYPKTPEPGKITLLYDKNKSDLYHKLSPYGHDTFLFIKSRQPFIYKFPDEKIGTMDKYAVREFPFGRATTDVVRVTKFLTSGQGILWLGKQFLLQTGNAFNETRLYNPASPILGAAMPLSLWAFRPQRNIDLGNIGSIIGSFLGPTVGSIFSTRTAPPPGTLSGGLPTTNQNAGKGLLRAGTANKALTGLQTKWAGPSSGKGIGFGKFLSETIKGLFGNFIPQRQQGKVRSDENTYGLMLTSYSGDDGAFSYQSINGIIKGVQQFWYAGESSSIRKGGTGKPANWVKIYIDDKGKPIFLVPKTSYRIEGLTGNVGYSVTAGGKPVKYGDFVGDLTRQKVSSRANDWEASDVLIQHSMYGEDGKKYPSKGNDQTDPSVEKIQRALNTVINKIEESKLYEVDKNGRVSIFAVNKDKIGYDRIAAMKNHQGDNTVETQYKYSYLKEYREKNIRVLENQHASSPKYSMKMASSRQFDYINTLEVLDGEKLRVEDWITWNPYKDDLIAFYFYDVVNDKYIPFRATVRNLQETDSTNWEELSFIGRADRLYSYGGYNRSLTFGFTIVINSIKELAPTWQRINYLMSLVKPSQYTSKQMAQANINFHSRFIVPPMVMITIGDLYKNQPVVVASIGITIPDTALWETLNEKNSDEWSYLANYIKAPSIGKRYGQLPKTVEISVNAYILEKERAIAGAAHFGHAPHDEEYIKDKWRTTAPDYEQPNELHKSMVVYNSVNNKYGKSIYEGDVNINSNVPGSA